MMHAEHRKPNRTSYTLIGPDKSIKGSVTTLMALSIDTATKNMIESKQVGNQAIGASLYGWEDLFEKLVEFLGTSIAKKTILSTSDSYTFSWAFHNKKFESINRLDITRPDFIENSKRIITNTTAGQEWFDNRAVDAVEALKKIRCRKIYRKY